MLIGIMSDSHGDSVMTARAIELLEANGAIHLFHCGDICHDSVLEEFAGHNVTFVWGNCDVPTPLMRKYVTALGLQWPEQTDCIELGGRRLGIFHGHELSFAATFNETDLDYALYGHTHLRADRYEGECRFINPGALHRAAIHTVATLDLESNELIYYEVETGDIVEVPTQGILPAKT